MYRLAADALLVGDAFDQSRPLHAESSAALRVFRLAGRDDLSLEAALLEQEVVELHRLW
jgi:hypothetical protein